MFAFTAVAVFDDFELFAWLALGVVSARTAALLESATAGAGVASTDSFRGGALAGVLRAS